MPIISTFFGIVIHMFYSEHEPAHFHAEYQGERASFLFSGKPLAGQISSGHGASFAIGLRCIVANWRPTGAE